MQLVNFESFRDLVTMLQTGYPERKGIALAEQTNVELRAAARAVAKAEVGASSRQAGPQAAPPSQPGKPDPCSLRSLGCSCKSSSWS